MCGESGFIPPAAPPQLQKTISFAMPTICVVMPVYNDAVRVERAVRSVLEQSCRDFQLIAVDDGSTDATPALLERLAHPRLLTLRNEVNRGVEFSLNRGIAAADCRWVLRLDSDDECLPGRLEKQLAWLEDNPGAWVLGGWAELVFPDGESFSLHVPVRNEWIRARLLFQNSFVHPAVAMQRRLFERIRYSDRYPAAEDYELWCRLAANPEGLFHNLPEFLVKYSFSPAGISGSRRMRQIQSSCAVREAFLRRLGVEAGAGLRLYQCMAEDAPPGRIEGGEAQALLELLAALRKRLMQNRYTSYGAFYNELSPRFSRLARAACAVEPGLKEIFADSEFYQEQT